MNPTVQNLELVSIIVVVLSGHSYSFAFFMFSNFLNKPHQKIWILGYTVDVDIFTQLNFHDSIGSPCTREIFRIFNFHYCS